MSLTDHQDEVYQDILDFLYDDIDLDNLENLIGLLEGQAGVGKSHIMRQVVKYIKKELNQQVLCVAPTHKARKVLNQFVNKGLLIKIPTCTVASLLNKTKAHSYIGTNRYIGDGGNKINSFDVFIIDEVSMISDEDLKEIKKYALMYHKKVLFVGDDHQIPHPTQTFKIVKNKEGGCFCEKKDNLIFEKPYNLFRLEQILRQKKDSEIIEYYTHIRKNLLTDTTFPPKEGNDVIIFSKKEKFEEKNKRGIFKRKY